MISGSSGYYAIVFKQDKLAAKAGRLIWRAVEISPLKF
jgi:hypothetical protein